MHSAPRSDAPQNSPAPNGPSAALAGRAGRTSAAVLGVLTALLLAAVAAGWAPLLDVDASIARTTHRWAVSDPTLTHANRILTDWIWDPWTMRALCAVLVVWLWWLGDRRLAVWAGASCLFATLLQQVLKAAVGRERPTWPDPVDSANFAAFPSGHAMTAAFVGGLVLWALALRRAGRALWWTALAVTPVSVAGVGWTRVWLGVHWPTDVLGGWLLGAFLVLLTGVLYGRTARAGRPTGS
ncbi:phosphatase PAP2 family protein [Streptomyces cavernicola]|uniref:Phosphatase PAP2 family protein n=1 Tax=Streptomyces cavernicola TaxID=3043613 RepID=A0ABT6S991_9ACTN|nr:phosphatase PAP2 family protein [Streptomyces sp. B-S-A6]MDI3404675.1 phosphatase PAP2 family protein [Streptomyces sp. B-S-A6]